MALKNVKSRARAQLGWVRAHRSSILVGLLTLLVALLSAVWLDDKDAWGAVGQWAGAFGTVIAVTVALRIAQREAEGEAARARAEKAEYELQQARLVVVDIEYPSYTDEQSMKQVGIDPFDTVKITNFSAAHVFYPRIEGFVHQNGGTTTWDIWSDDPEGYVAPTFLPSGESDEVPVYINFDPPITPAMYPLRTKVIIGFTDVGGRRWRRVGEGTPERVPSDDSFEIDGPPWYRAER